MKKAENELSSYSGILSAFVGKAPKEMKPKEKAVEEPRGDQQIRKLSGYEWAGTTQDQRRGAIAKVNFSDLRGNTRQKWRFQDVEYCRGTTGPGLSFTIAPRTI